MYLKRNNNLSLLIMVLSFFTINIFAIDNIELPFPCNKTYRVSQGNNSAYSHTGYGSYAFDFAMGIGEVVTAVAPGTVTKIKEDSNTHCYPDTTCPGTANYVLIDHGDGSSSVYLHLKQWSVNVSVGDLVLTGQAIGQVGLTGRTSGPHLHFQLQSTWNLN